VSVFVTSSSQSRKLTHAVANVVSKDFTADATILLVGLRSIVVERIVFTIELSVLIDKNDLVREISADCPGSDVSIDCPAACIVHQNILR